MPSAESVIDFVVDNCPSWVYVVLLAAALAASVAAVGLGVRVLGAAARSAGQLAKVVAK